MSTRSYSPLATWRRSLGLSRSDLARLVDRFVVSDIAADVALIEGGLRAIDYLHPDIAEKVPREVLDAHKKWERSEVPA